MQLTHQKLITFIAICHSAKCLTKLLNSGLIQLRKVMKLSEKGLLILWHRPRYKIQIWLIVLIRRRIGIDGMNSIQAEPIHAPVKPEARHVCQSISHSWISMIQVWLTCQKIMQIILLASWLPTPGTSAKEG